MSQLAWKAGTEQYPPQELLDYAVAAEKAGFDAIEASDHFHPWAEKGQASFVWSWLGAVAGRTKKIVLGTGVTCPILRYHPAVVAQAAATMACLAPGRFFLGVGTGEALNEFATIAQWPAYKVRQTQLAEAIELIRALWSGDKVSYKGAHYQTRQAKLYTLPADPIPILISTMVPNSARFAARHGDGLITVGGEEPEVYREIFQQFDAEASASGKDGKEMPRMVELAVAYTEDSAKAIEYRQAYWAGTYVPALFTEKIYTPQMSETNGKIVGADTVRESVCISRDPEDHIRLAEKYMDLGFDRLVFHCAGPDQRNFIEAYGRDVLPELRRKWQAKDKTAA